MRQRHAPFWEIVVAGTTLALSIAGCSGGSNTAGTADRPVVPKAPSSLIAEVDSIGVPARIAPTDTLSVRLRGTVGPNGCYAFGRTAIERAPQQVRLVPLVQRPSRKDAACTMALVPLDETVRLDPPFEAGALTITVPQPNRENVSTTVTVTDDE